MSKRIPDSPTSPDAVPVASDGILAADEQAKLAAARASHVERIQQIKDPKKRFAAIMEQVSFWGDVLLDFGSIYPGAAPFITGIRQATSRIKGLMSAAQADGARTE